jgi:hypothetical protein
MFEKRRPPQPNENSYQVAVRLHYIRRRLELSQFTIEAHQRAAILRRQLDAELDDLDRQEGAS